MRLPLGLSIVWVAATTLYARADLPLAPVYSTYLGGSNWEHARDVFTDGAGFTYVVGGTGSADFVGTGSFPPPNTYNAGAANNTADGAFGGADVFISKVDPAGQVLWTKYMGGPNYDRAYAVEVDGSGNIYVAGRAGTGFPTTNGFQTTFSGTSNPSNYGNQNGFVAKLDASGTILWSSYVGTGELVRDLALDAAGDVYIPLVMSAQSSRSAFTTPALSAFAGKFTNSAPTTNTGDVGVAKLKGDGSGVVWARWIGGSGDEATNPSIRVNAAGEPHLLFNTTSTSTSLATVGAGVQANNGGGRDSFLVRFNATGTGLIYGTYIGGTGTEAHETHSLTLDAAGNAVIAIHTDSPNFISGGTISGNSDIGLAKFNSSGVRIAGAIYGGNGGENPDGIYLDSTGRVFLALETNSTDFPTTVDGWDRTFGGTWDGALVKLSADLATMEYGSYIGGALYDNARTLFLGSDGSVYLAGGTLSTDFPPVNAFDSTFNGGSHAFAPGSGDAWVARFAPLPEPSSATLLSFGAALALSLRVRRSSRVSS